MTKKILKIYSYIYKREDTATLDISMNLTISFYGQNNMKVLV